jgi:DNA-binding XRE family transcriptional regulator
VKPTSRRKARRTAAPAKPRFATLQEYVDAQPRTKSQEQIADELGVAPNTLWQYLKGRSSPSKEIALRLARDFNISLEGLFATVGVSRRAS